MKLIPCSIFLLLMFGVFPSCQKGKVKDASTSTVHTPKNHRTTSSQAAVSQCFAHREANGINMMAREAKLDITNNQCKLVYTGFSRPDNFNFTATLTGGLQNGQFVLSGNATSYGMEKAAKAVIRIQGMKLRVDYTGGFGTEKMTLQRLDCSRLEFMK